MPRHRWIIAVTVLTTTVLAILVPHVLHRFSPTQVTVRVLEHRPNPGGGFVLLYRVLSPNDLAGRYGIGETRRSDLLNAVDGHDYQVGLNFTMVGTLTQNRPFSYMASPPSSTRSDFLESATLIQSFPADTIGPHP